MSARREAGRPITKGMRQGVFCKEFIQSVGMGMSRGVCYQSVHVVRPYISGHPSLEFGTVGKRIVIASHYNGRPINEVSTLVFYIYRNGCPGK